MTTTKKLALDPIIQTFLDALAKQDGKPIYTLPPHEARTILDDVQAQSVVVLPVDIEKQSIAVGTTGNVSLHIVRPKGNTQKLPVILYMHGGGWVLGNFETHERLVRELAHGAQAAIVFVDYTAAPEGQYPLIHEQGYAAAQWVAAHGASLNLDGSRIIIAGDSVGGLEATAIALMALERGGPHFIAQLLIYPVTDAHFDTPSYNEFAQGPWLTKAAMQWFWDNYVPNKADRTKPWASPLQASLEQLKHLPPAIIVVNEYDVLRDEGEAYAHKLIEAGVSVVAIRLIGTIHDCLLLNAITQTPIIRAAVAHITGLLKDAFHRSS
jgi:acetyl esterase